MPNPLNHRPSSTSLQRPRPNASLALAAGCAIALSVGCVAVSTDRDRDQAFQASALEQAAAPLDPFDALQPKRETGVDRFLAEFPQFDGRGTVVAVFDTGIDPGAPGMQVTSDGRPKIVDMIDATGSGDVDTTTTREVGEDNTIEGLSGRTLTLGAWATPGMEVRVGLKPHFELTARGLAGRIRGDRREDQSIWAKALIEDLKRQLAKWDRANPSPDEDLFAEREELAAKLAQAESLWSSHQDFGPIHDCVVFHDGAVWRAVVDTDEDGDLAEEKALTNFRAEREFATFDDENLLNFACNIYDDGDTLSIVTDCGAHGTHVAGMVAAYYPDQPELSGIAPGAQLVSVKIGDHRVGSSSLGTGGWRGFRAVLDNDVDVINQSYGGSSPLADEGRRTTLINELVQNHGVVYVASAGNSGPAMTTAGSPGGTTESMIGVGAAVSKEMAKTLYNVRDPGLDLQFSWSSRGPVRDGALGVDISAPGAAYSPVPNWLLQKNTMMNGTSMSSPSVAGGVALLISGAKQLDLPHAPELIKRAIKNTAAELEGEPFEVGAGMARFDRAWTYLSEYGDKLDADVQYYATVNQTGGRGIYLREPWQLREKHEFTINIDPRFPKDTDSRRQVDFEVRLDVAATAPWINATGVAFLNANNDGLRVEVDPTGLTPGVHSAAIVLTDADRPERGELVRVPVTVTKPLTVNDETKRLGFRRLSQQAGEIERVFVEVPEGATWADIVLRRLDEDTNRLVVVHGLQLRDEQSFPSIESQGWLTLETRDEKIQSMDVVAGGTLEIALCNYWSNPGTAQYEYDVRFGGISMSPIGTMIGGQGATQLEVIATCGDQRVNPSGSFDTLTKTVRAKDWSVTPLSTERDGLWDGRLAHELVVEYEFEITEAMEISFDVGGSGVQSVTNGLESTLVFVKNENGKIVHITAGWGSANLAKGSYTAEFHARHDNAKKLESVAKSPLYLHADVGPINIAFMSNQLQNESGRAFFAETDIEEGRGLAVYAVAPDRGAMPKGAEAGDVLSGSVTFGTSGDRLYGSSSRSEGFPITCVVPPKQGDKPEIEPSESKKDEQAEDEEELAPADKLAKELADGIFEMKMGKLAAIEDDELFATVYAELETEIAEAREGDAGESLKLLAVKLERVSKDEDASLDDKLAAADAILGSIDRENIAAWNGVKRDKDAEDYDEDRAEAVKVAEKHLKLALDHRARALMAAAEASEGGEQTAELLERFEDALDEIDRWSDLAADDRFDLRLAKTKLQGHKAQALAMVRAKVKDEPEKKAHREDMVALLEELGWDEWAEIERRRTVVEFPAVARPF